MSITKGHLACVFVALASTASFLAACSGDDGAPSSSTSSSSSSGGSSGSTTSSSGTSGSTSSSGDASTETDGGSSGSSGSSGDAGKKALLAACGADAECASNVCYLGDTNAYCSLKCTADTAATVCVAPFNGVCNNKGFCRKP